MLFKKILRAITSRYFISLAFIGIELFLLFWLQSYLNDYLLAFYVSFVYSYSLAKKFNKGIGFGLGIFLLNPIFMPILAFSNKCVYNK